MKFICPLITVSDMATARHFYENILKLKVKYDFGENVTYDGDFAIHLQAHFQCLIDQKKIVSGGNNFELYFEDDHPEKIIEQLEQHQIELVHDLREQPWRQRVVRFYDPDQNIIEVGESMEHVCFRLHTEGKKAEEIEAITMMPQTFISEAIKAYQ